jgi:competence protein ComGC
MVWYIIDMIIIIIIVILFISMMIMIAHPDFEFQSACVDSHSLVCIAEFENTN